MILGLKENGKKIAFKTWQLWDENLVAKKLVLKREYGELNKISKKVIAIIVAIAQQQQYNEL